MNKIFAVVQELFYLCRRFRAKTASQDAGLNVMFFQSAAMGSVNVATGGVGASCSIAANGKVIRALHTRRQCRRR